MAAIALTGVVAYATSAAAQTYNYGPGVASGAQVAATVNAPLEPGDYITTGSGSNAEVQFDGREVQLAAGTVDLPELQGADGSPQIDTPLLTIRPNQTGDYRVTVCGNGETLVTVRSGAATIATAYGSQTLTPGSTLVVYGSSIRRKSDRIRFVRPIQQFARPGRGLSLQLESVSVATACGLLIISPTTVSGKTRRATGTHGLRTTRAKRTSHRIRTASGCGSQDTAIRGLTMRRTAMRRLTTERGSTTQAMAGGYGSPRRIKIRTRQQARIRVAAGGRVLFLAGNNGADLGNLLNNAFGFLGNSGNANMVWIPLAPGKQYQPWYGQNNSYPSTGLTNVTNVTDAYNYYSNAPYYRGLTMVPVSAWRNGNFKRAVVLRPQQLKQIVLIRGAVPVVPTTANLHYSSITAVKHPVVLSRAFAAPRLPPKHRLRRAFHSRRKRRKSDRSPAYRRRSCHGHRTPIHLTAIKPVTHQTGTLARATQTAAPAISDRSHRLDCLSSGRFSLVLSRTAHAPEQSAELFVRDLVTFACRIFEAVSIENGDRSMSVTNEAGLLQGSSGDGDAGTTRTEHHCKVLMGEGNFVAIYAIVRHQKPPRASLVHAVEAIASSELP